MVEPGVLSLEEEFRSTVRKVRGEGLRIIGGSGEPVEVHVGKRMFPSPDDTTAQLVCVADRHLRFDQAARKTLRCLLPDAPWTLLPDLEEAVSRFRDFPPEWEYGWAVPNRRRRYRDVLRAARKLRQALSPVEEFLPSPQLDDLEQTAARLVAAQVKPGPRKRASYQRLVQDFCVALHVAGVDLRRTRGSKVEKMFRLVYAVATRDEHGRSTRLREDLLREMRSWPFVGRCSDSECRTCIGKKNLGPKHAAQAT